MTFLRVIPALVSALLIGAHFLRQGSLGLTAACVAAPFLLLLKRAWVPVVARWLLVGAATVWVMTAVELARVRMALGEPWIRMAVILGAVAGLALVGAALLRGKALARRYAKNPTAELPGALAFGLTAGLLAIVQLKVQLPMLLLERFVSGGGWFAILLLAAYAALVVERLLDRERQPKWRRRIWLLFSVVFFAQLALGLSGAERFLLTGELHLPVPALIVAGPLYRGEGLFMPILFGATLLLVGPAWCSHLCYIGAWDGLVADTRKRPRPLPGWTRHARIGLLAAVVLAALGLRLAGASTPVAGGVGLGFGLVGVLVMVIWSRRFGAMAHCVVFCPIGLLANLLGKLSPFRIRLGEGCTECGKCSRACRYDALAKADIERRRPAITCTLCGDCVERCAERQIGYRFAGLGGERARAAFVVIVVALHAAFLGVARI